MLVPVDEGVPVPAVHIRCALCRNLITLDMDSFFKYGNDFFCGAHAPTLQMEYARALTDRLNQVRRQAEHLPFPLNQEQG
jgi:hypothetical protein